jgi:hypothetical protein
MDLLLKALQKGDLPKDWLQEMDIVPAKRKQRLNLFCEKVEMLLNNVFLGANEELFYSFMEILENTSDLDESELYEIRNSVKNKTHFAAILSTVKDYYFCKEGFRVLVSNSNSRISYSYLVGESVLHVYDLGEDVELGVVMLSKDTTKEFTYLTERFMEWVGGRPFFTDGCGDYFISK